MFRRIWTLFLSRNKEFYRDKTTLGWNILFPFLVILGFSGIFNEEEKTLYKVGVLLSGPTEAASTTERYNTLKQTKYIEFIPLKSEEQALNKLRHHRLDLLINPTSSRYWVSRSSPKGYVVERLLQASLTPTDSGLIKQSVKGREVPYVEWLLPGILGTNIMFSALFGVGYVVVRYRKNGMLKRLSVTPLRPFEFLTAQVISRMFLLLATTSFVIVGCMLIFGLKVHGSYLSLIFVFAVGGFCLVSFGLIIASRGSSEEFTSGLLNLITWPMMFLSEVWFSLEGANPWVQKLSKLFPLTHVIDAARKIMNDGAGLFEVRTQIITLIIMSFVFLIFGSLLFKWHN